MPEAFTEPNADRQATVGPPAAQDSPLPPVSARASSIAVWLRDLIISLAISAFIIIFLYQPVKVEGTSMMPSLEDQERIFVNKFVYRLEPIERGDIVVFRYPRDPSKSYIKRVIGMAGDRIRIDAGEVFVNGQQLDESYVPSEYADFRSYPEIIVPPQCYFVLGDHRSMSNDSRDFGPVNQSFIYGKAVFGYWPMDKLGRVR
jgi:signal peptidase I